MRSSCVWAQAHGAIPPPFTSIEWPILLRNQQTTTKEAFKLSTTARALFALRNRQYLT